MKTPFLLLPLALATFALAGEKREPLEIKPRTLVTEKDTDRAIELLHDLPKLTPEAAAARLSELLKDRDIPRQAAGPWFELIARVGGPQELQQLYVGLMASLPDDCCEGASGRDFDRTFAFPQDSDLLRAGQVLLQAAEQRGARPASPYRDGKLHLGDHIYSRGPEGMETDLARLAVLFHVVEDYPRLADRLRGPDVHQGSYDALVLARGPEAVEAVEPYALGLGENLAARGALLILARIDPERALKHTARILSAPMDDEVLAHLWTQLIASKPYTERLLAAPPWYLPSRVRAAGEAAARAAGRTDLAEKLAPREEQAIPPHEFEGLAEKVRAQGDAARGELVFRGDTAACASCHALGGVGPDRENGPDLGRIGAESQLTEIISDTLQPYARVKKEYEVFSRVLKETTMLAGTSQKHPESVYLTAPAILKVGETWPPADAHPYHGTTMPAGLTDALSAQETRDLFAFLAKLGAPDGLNAGQRTVARVWRLESDPGNGKWIFMDGITGGTCELTSLLNGDVSRDNCRETIYDTLRHRPFAMMTRFTTKTEGQVRFTLTGLQEAWIDKVKVEIPATGEITLELPAGPHRLDIQLKLDAMPETIRAASPDAEFSTASVWK